MARCNFCKEDRFQSEQGVKAHMKTCERYLAEKAKKARAASGSVPQVAAAPGLSAPKLDVVKPISEQSLKRDASSTPLQQRRTILQAVKKRVIDCYMTSLGQVTNSMRGHAKLIIEQTLAKLPLEEIGLEEASETAVAIRDRLYASAFTGQEQAAERQRVESAAHKKKEVETLGALIRADRRKKMLCQQASQQAEAFCQEKKITGWAHVNVLADVESRLEVFLTGDEPILEAQAIVRSVLEGRVAEAQATLAATRAKADEQWREEIAAALVLGTLVSLVGLSLRYPEHTAAFFNWLERTFGFAPGAEARASNPEASETSSATASAETHPPSTHRREYPITPSDPPFQCAPSGVAMQGQA
ncbi:MAG: hypothetical protein ABI955_01125 [Nitrospirota bacterium]